MENLIRQRLTDPPKPLITIDSDSMALEILHRLSEEQGRFCYFGERRSSNIWDTGLGSSPLSIWKAEGLSGESQGPHRPKCIGHSPKGASTINSWILAAAFSHPLLLSIWLETGEDRALVILQWRTQANRVQMDSSFLSNPGCFLFIFSFSLLFIYFGFSMGYVAMLADDMSWNHKHMGKKNNNNQTLTVF